MLDNITKIVLLFGYKVANRQDRTRVDKIMVMS